MKRISIILVLAAVVFSGCSAQTSNGGTATDVHAASMEISTAMSDTVNDYLEDTTFTDEAFVEQMEGYLEELTGNLRPALRDTSLMEAEQDEIHTILSEFIDSHWTIIIEESISIKPLYTSTDPAEMIRLAGDLKELMEKIHTAGDDKQAIFDLQRAHRDALPTSNYLADLVGAETEAVDLARPK